MRKKKGRNEKRSDDLYGAHYYASHCGPFPYDRSYGHWIDFFGKIADELIRIFQPVRVFDAGCAHGFLVEAFWDRGVEAYGRDISEFAISQVRQDIRQYCSVGSLTEKISGKFDLVVCIEVLEHMSEEDGLKAIANMTAATDHVVFSSSPTDLTEPTHVNVKPAIYWMRLFAKQGFTPSAGIAFPTITPYALVFSGAKVAPRDQELIACAELVRARLQLAERQNTIYRLTENVAERDRSLAARDSHIAQINQTLVQLNGDIAAETNKTVELTQTIAGLHSHIAERDKLVGAQDSQIEHLNQIIAQRDTQIAAEANKNTELVQAILDSQNQVAERSQLITAQSEKFAEQQQLVAQLHSRITEIVQAILDSQNQVAERNQLIAAQSEKFAEQQQLVAELHNRIEARDQLVQQLTLALSDQTLELEQANISLQKQVAERDQLIASHDKEIAEVKEVVAGLRNLAEESDKQLSDRSNEIAEITQAAMISRDQLAERDSTISAQRDEIAKTAQATMILRDQERDSTISAQRDEIAKIAQATMILRDQERDSTISAQRDEIAEIAQAAMILGDQIAERDSKICTQKDEITAHKDEIARINLLIEEIRLKTESAIKEARFYRAAYQEILASTSWRSTAFARSIASRMPTKSRQLLGRALKIFGLSSPQGSASGKALVDRSHEGAIADRSEHSEKEIGTYQDLLVGPDDFDRDWYLSEYPDIAAAGVDPLYHYVKYGKDEGRFSDPSAAADARCDLASSYPRWVELFDTLTDSDRNKIRKHIQTLQYKPLISILMPVYETPESLLVEAINSVRNQLYPYWELCIADDASPATRVVEILRSLSSEEPRIKWMRRGKNGHISAASNSALSLASGEFVALMDHDDLLPDHALYEIAVALNKHPKLDLIYSDEDQIDADGRRTAPYFKTDWNPDLMLAHNMVSHFGVFRRALLEQVGGFRVGFEGSQDYDLTLRCADATTADRILHIPLILYHWRRNFGTASFSERKLVQCSDAFRRAVSDHLDRKDQIGKVTPHPVLPQWARVVRPVPDPAPLVSIIVPTRDRADLLGMCIEGLLHRTDYPAMELLIVDHESKLPETIELFQKLKSDPRVRILSFAGVFNYSAINNFAVSQAKGSLIGLVNNDIDVIHPDWLSEMVSLAVLDDVGAVGAKLLYPDGSVQHGGVVLGVGGVANHFNHKAARSDIGYFGRNVLTSSVSAVTGACLVVRKSVYDEVQGLNEVDLPVAFNDVDFCLRVKQKGYRNVWTPHAELYHHESASRGPESTPEKQARFQREVNYMMATWETELRHDPYYNDNFSLDIGHCFQLAPKPRRKESWS